MADEVTFLGLRAEDGHPHLFEALVNGRAYTLFRIRGFLHVKADDSGKPILVSRRALNRYFAKVNKQYGMAGEDGTGR